ncbi:hypothetical protein PybrP1_008999 [[Pythium] brassicae (nom. inval.)]|nr:hypothetical protein PybrP1_008999 [[Pythium] brassicae (nom. inval.)]
MSRHQTLLDIYGAPKYASNVAVVLSVYGDGFIEIPTAYGAELRDGFSLAIRVFKAADIESSTSHCDDEDSRHSDPELDDSGDFVRWACCGSTEPTVYGCSAKRTMQSRAAAANLEKDAPAPKLIACKLPSPSQPDAICFLIYDRGSSVPETQGGPPSLDAGCHVWYKERECCATQYALPSNRWALLYVTFDHEYLRVYIDDRLVDSASVRPSGQQPAPSCASRLNPTGRTAWAAAATSNPNSIYIGGHPSYSRSVREWRKRIGFVGLVASVAVWKTADALGGGGGDRPMILDVVCTGVGRVKDYSWYNHSVNAHRSVFWRKLFPPIPTSALLRSDVAPSAVASAPTARIDLLDDFFHGSHTDKAVTTAKTFENLLLAVVQSGDVRVVVKFALDFDMTVGSEHGCRTKKEYAQRLVAVVHELEAMSPLLTVLVNEDEGKPVAARIGSFEVALLLARDAARGLVAIPLHSMASTSMFPNADEIKKKIRAVILHEAKRFPGESVQLQAFRYFLSLAGRSRINHERSFLEAVITRRVVLTERKVVSAFEKIGFCFADSELPGIVRHFKFIQDDYMRKQRRMEDLPTLSMLAPTADGLYVLPLLDSLSVCTTLDCDGSDTSPWRFVGVLLDHDSQLLEFIHEECPVSQDGTTSLHQTRYLHGSFVRRVNVKLSRVSGRVFCVLFCLQKIGFEASAGAVAEGGTSREVRARVQVENAGTHQALGLFDLFPKNSCRWFTLAALYRSKKPQYWKVQALGGSSQANSIHAGLDDMHELLVRRAIIQIYEIVVRYERAAGSGEFEEYAKRFSRNIRFGRNGRISLEPVVRSGLRPSDSQPGSSRLVSPLVISLDLQGRARTVEVYRHDSGSRSLPTTQSVYRDILGILSEHGIKESLQQNPFVAQEHKLKRHVEIHVIDEQTSAPVERAHVFVEKNLDNIRLAESLAKKIVPTLTMGSRLVSIRRRLQMKRVGDERRAVAAAFVGDVVSTGTKLALFSLRRDAKLLPYVRSRAMVKRAMRRRYERSKELIFEQVKESERSRIYSRNGPIRLQQAFQRPLEFSRSEKELLEDVAAFGIDALKTDGLRPSNDARAVEQDQHVYEIWKAQKRRDGGDPDLNQESESESDADDDSLRDAAKPADASVTRDRDPSDAIQSSLERAKARKFCYVSDCDGKVTCRLSPGSYSLYIFHLEFFEWTSLVVVFPSANNPGAQSSAGMSCTAAQEILAPLEAYRWTYKIQLVDFYQQQSVKLVAGIPIQVVDKCSAQQYVVTTDQRGCAAWEVGKGLYSVSALKDCSCVLYSASKNVVVDGGRYRPAKTIFIPVLIGKLAIEFVLAAAVPVSTSPEQPMVAAVRFKKRELDSLLGREGASIFDEARAELSTRTLAVGSSLHVPLRLGCYDVEVSSDCFLPASVRLAVEWDTSKANARFLAVLHPLVDCRDASYRIVFSYVNAAKAMDAIVESFRDDTLVSRVWRQSPASLEGHVVLEHVSEADHYELQTFKLTCYTYRCKVASTLSPWSTASRLHPRVQIFAGNKLVHDRSLASEARWQAQFYWTVGEWDASGEFIALS